MNHFTYKNQSLYCENVALSTIAETYGTPAYVYSRATLTENFLAYQNALGEQEGLICYAVKANSNIAVLNVLAKLGAGFDIVSIGELERVLRAGGSPEKIVFSGVAKTEQEMQRALEAGVHRFGLTPMWMPTLTRISLPALKKINSALISNRPLVFMSKLTSCRVFV